MSSSTGNILTSGVDQLISSRLECSLKFEVERVIGNDYISCTNFEVKRLMVCGCGSSVAMETLHWSLNQKGQGPAMVVVLE